MLQKIPVETPKQLKMFKMDFRPKIIKTNKMTNILFAELCVPTIRTYCAISSLKYKSWIDRHEYEE
jgi:hypothetical protein